MRKFFKAVVSATPALAAVLIFGLSATRCTTVDDTLGQNFIPPYQQMKLRVDTLSSIDTYIANNDTIPSAYHGRLYVGSMTDPAFGRTQASGMTDFYPSSIWTFSGESAQNFYGYHPVADSVYMELYVSAIHGDTTVAQTFHVYQLTDSLRRDTMYFVNEPLEKRVDLDKPLFTFTVKNDAPVGAVLFKKLEPTDEGRAFVKKLVELDSMIYKESLHNFHKEFYGLYIAPAPESPENAAVYEFNLRITDSYGIPISAMYIWGHSYEEKSPTTLKDTVMGTYRFSDAYWYPNPNINANKVTFTYPAEIADHINDTTKNDTPLSTVYVQGLGGVATYLRFTDALMTQLENLKKQDGMEYSAVVINEARLYFPLEDPTTDNMNGAPTRLGMYYTYGQPQQEGLYPGYSYRHTVPYFNYTPVYGPRPLLDYAYQAENHPTSSSSIPYGGYIQRTQGYYKMDVTGYLTLLINYPDVTPREVWLGPEVNTRAITYNQVALKGSQQEENPIKLVLTYTLIK